MTLVTGASEYNRAAAERLARILKPWNVTCTTLAATEASRPRPLDDDEARTWIGLDYAGSGQIKPGSSNAPAQVGFAVRGATLLLGNPDDNPLIKFVADQRFLSYRPVPSHMPGPRRGSIAWQREAIGVNQESITLLAFDAAGMDEAVATLYEMMVGLEPLTRLAQPVASTIAPARNADLVPELAIDWHLILPDRVTGLKATPDAIEVLTRAGTHTLVSPNGDLREERVVAGIDYDRVLSGWVPAADPDSVRLARQLSPVDRLVKLVATRDGMLAVAYWGGTISLFDSNRKLAARRQFAQDITALRWLGDALIVGDADGRLCGLRAANR